MTLRVRLAAFVAAAVCITVIFVSLASYRSARDEAIDEIDAFLRGRTPVGGLLEGLGPGPQGPGRRQGPFAVVGEDVVAQILFEDGTVFALGTGPVVLPVDDEDLEVAAGFAPDRLQTVEIEGVGYRTITRRAGPGVAFQVGRDLTETEAILAGLRNRLLLIGLTGAAAAAAAGWLLARRAVKPVAELTEAAEQVAATGALDAAIAVRGADEISRLATAFNEMLARLESSRAAQQRLVADASHELRTPLTSLRTNIELLARGNVPDSERAALVDDLNSEVAELGDLVSELVDLAIVGRPDEPKRHIDLSHVVAQVARRADRRAPQAIEVAARPTPVAGRPSALSRAVSNLIDNAIKWSPDGGTITVTLDEQGLRVEDEGPGFDPDDLPHVFERFYRASTARALPGSGLGLAIVAAVVEDHGWTVLARNGDRGAEVGFEFGTGGGGVES